VKGCGRIAVSCGDGQGLLFTVGGVSEAGEDVLLGEVGEVGEDFGVGHAGGEVGEDVVDGDSHSSNAGFAAAFAGFEGDDVLVVHGWLSGRSMPILAYRSIFLPLS
jgi:hypothetical protein